MICACLFIFPSISAYTVPYHIKEVTEIVDLQTGEEKFNFLIVSEVDGLKYFDFAFKEQVKAETLEGDALEVQDLGQKKRIYFPQPLKAGQSIAFVIKAVSGGYAAGDTYFYKGFSTPYDVDKFRLLVVFPKGIMPQVSTFDRSPPNCCAANTFQRSTSIPPDGVELRDGRVTLMWERSLKAGESFEVGIHLPESRSHAYATFAILAIAAVTFLAGFQYAKRRRRDEVAKVFLNEEERAIVEFIRRNGGEVLQETIWKSEVLPFSRPKVSRIISELESRGLIVREPHKKTFKVKLNV